MAIVFDSQAELEAFCRAFELREPYEEAKPEKIRTPSVPMPEFAQSQSADAPLAMETAPLVQGAELKHDTVLVTVPESTAPPLELAFVS